MNDLKRAAKCSLTIPCLDIPINNRTTEALTEVQVTDPTHPLFGRCFAPLRRLTPSRGQTHVLMVYREGVFLRLPLVVTDLVLSERRPPSKLTTQAVTELVTLAEQSRLLCPSPPKPSGNTSARNVDAPSLPN